MVLVARAAWRRRWPSQLFVAALTAVAVAAVVAPLTAATRSEGAFTRLRATTRASDAVVDNWPDAARRELDAARRAAGVEGVAADAELFVRPLGSGYFPDYDLYARAPLDRNPDGLNAPVITSGRAARPDRADEVALSEGLASELGLHVGDTVALESMTSKWVDVAFNGGDPGAPDGPRMRVKVVGLARSPADFGRFKGLLHFGRAFVARYGAQFRVYHHVELRLSAAGRRAGIEGVLRDVSKVAEIGPSPFADDAGTDDALATTAIALRLVAAAAALAGAVVLALALARVTRVALGEAPTLTALGWTTRQLAGAALVSAAPWVVGGVVAGLLAGAALAPHVMLGLARRVDPAPGAIVVHVAVVLVTAAAALALALLVAALTARRSKDAKERRVRHPGAALALVRPLPVTLGARLAVRGDAEGGGRASRGALLVMIAGVASIVAAFTVSASIARLQSDPGLTGQARARVIDSGESTDAYDRALPLLDEDRRVALLVGTHVVFGIHSGPVKHLTALAYDVRRGELPMSVVHGRLATQPDEVAMGPATLDVLHKHLGDDVELRGDRGSRTYRIVGSVLFPEGDFSHDEGIAFTADAASPLVGNVHDRGAIHQVVFDWAAGTDARGADRALAAAGLRPLTATDLLVPASVRNLGLVEALPRHLGVFLLLMALVTLGHALATNVKRRARELGTLRALGMTARSVAGIVASQALVILVLALVVGVPFGLVLGAKVWTPIANGAHVVIRAVRPGGWIVGGMIATLAAVCALTAVSAWNALHLSTRDVLRAE